MYREMQLSLSPQRSDRHQLSMMTKQKILRTPRPPDRHSLKACGDGGQLVRTVATAETVAQKPKARLWRSL